MTVTKNKTKYYLRAPHDCAQWMTGSAGFVKSYSWKGGDQIQGNEFTFCIRREDGYCNIVYKPASDTAPTSATRYDFKY